MIDTLHNFFQNHLSTNPYNHIMDVEFYNEAALQFKLGYYLNKKFSESKNISIDIERNVKDLGYEKDLLKSEMDIVLRNENEKTLDIIEIKNPPINSGDKRLNKMNQAFKDIRFLEELSEANKNSRYRINSLTFLFFINNCGKKVKNYKHPWNHSTRYRTNPFSLGQISENNQYDFIDERYILKNTYNNLNWFPKHNNSNFYYFMLTVE